MALFGDQTTRVIREKWATSVQLSQELFAMFSGKIPMTIDAPVTINNPPSTGGTPGNPIVPGGITINSPVTTNGPVTNNGPVINNGDTTLNGPTTNIKEGDTTKPIDDYIKEKAGNTGGLGVLYGYTEGGTGDTYRVTVPGSPDGSLNVRFPNLNSNDKIDDGTFICPIILVGSEYLAMDPPQRAYYGKVTGGSGTDYSCEIYTLSGSLLGSASVTVHVMDPSSTLPAGSPIFPIYRSSGGYYCQPPIWL